MQTVKFTGHGGLQLAGNLHSPASQDGRNDCVIICHGFRGGKEGSGRAIVLGNKIAELGMFALCFDFSGTGESEGDFADSTLTQYILDLSGAIDFTCSFTNGKIFLLGRSLGGTTAICQAARDKRVAAVCTWAAPSDLTETFLKPASPLLKNAGETLEIPQQDGYYLIKRGFFEDLSKYDVISAARQISPRPMLVIHGTDDETVLFKQGRELYEAAREPKNKLFVSGGDHRFIDHYSLVEKTTLDWLQGLSEKEVIPWDGK